MCWGVGVSAGGLGKCRERCGKVCWGVRGDGGCVKKCWGRFEKVCWGVGRCDEVLGEVWESVERGVEKFVGGGKGRCREVSWGVE